MAWRRRRNDIIWLVALLSLSAQEATEDSTEDNVVEDFVSKMLSRHSKFVSVRCKVERRLSTTGLTMTASQEVWRHIASYIACTYL